MTPRQETLEAFLHTWPLEAEVKAAQETATHLLEAATAELLEAA